MKIKIEKENFQKTLSKFQGIVEKRTIYPILSHVLIQARDEIFLEATDLEIGLREKVPGKIEEEGEACVEARKLYEIVREMPKEELYFETEDNFWVRISSGNISFRLAGLDPKDFPRFSEVKEEAFVIDGSVLTKMIKRVSFCASSQQSSMNLHGVLFEVEKGFLRLVATDGHRLALYQSEVEGAIKSAQWVLPKKGVMEIRKVFDKESRLSVKSKENLLHFEGEKGLLSVRLLEGGFPEYKYVLPSGLENKAIIDRATFLRALRRASVFSGEKGEGVKMSFSPDGKFELQVEGPSGEYREDLTIQYEGFPLRIMFNAHYLIEALNVMEEDRIRFELRDQESAALLREEKNDAYLYVVMPMRMLE
jgi:DNA polymerase-3 subunit beta